MRKRPRAHTLGAWGTATRCLTGCGRSATRAWTRSCTSSPQAARSAPSAASLRHLIDNDQPVPAELPPSMARWLEETGELPEWADRERLDHGCSVVVEHGPQVCVALATASLVYCYAGYPGVKVLTFSHRLDQDAYRRVGETAQFVLAVMPPGSLDAGGRGIRKIQKVRLLHAAIRHLVDEQRALGRRGRRRADLPGGPGGHAAVVLLDRRRRTAQARRADRRRARPRTTTTAGG